MQADAGQDNTWGGFYYLCLIAKQTRLYFRGNLTGDTSTIYDYFRSEVKESVSNITK